MLKPMVDEPAKVPETGLAMLDAEERGPLTPRARARARLADQWVEEAQAILDEHLDLDNPAASAQRAKNRAEFRWKRAAAAARDTYGERTQVDARVAVAVVTAFPAAAVAGEVAAEPDVLVKPPAQGSAYDADRGRQGA